MAKCTKAKELIITTQDKAGMLAEVTSLIASQGVNISAICIHNLFQVELPEFFNITEEYKIESLSFVMSQCAFKGIRVGPEIVSVVPVTKMQIAHHDILHRWQAQRCHQRLF